MFSIRYANDNDLSFWLALDHIRTSEFQIKVRDRRAYVMEVDGNPIGIMRYNLIWDQIPFLTLIIFQEEYRRKGFGRQAMTLWEDELRSLRYELVMTSTDVDESAQHFYRKLGYQDKGCLIMDIPPFIENMEMFLMKAL